MSGERLLIEFSADMVEFDTGGFYDEGVSATGLMAREPGTYVVTGEIAWSSESPAGLRAVELIQGDELVIATVSGPAVRADFPTTQQVHAIVRLEAADLVHLGALQGSGGELAIDSAVLSAAFLGT